MSETKRSTSFALSLALHAALLCAAFFNFTGTPRVNMDKPMYTVNLVSLNPSESPAAGETGEPAGAPDLAESPHPEAAPDAQAAPEGPPATEENAVPPEVRPRTVQRPAPEARPVPAPTPKAKPISERKVPAKTVPNVTARKQREDLLKAALKDVRQDVDSKSRGQNVKNALRDIRAKEGRAGKKGAVSGVLAALRKSVGGNIFTAGGTGRGGAGGGKGAGAGGQGTGLMSVYGDIVKQIIKKNWRYAAMGSEKNMAVVVEIRIASSGRITASRVVRSSGNSGFDNSAMSAVAQTRTLPPPRVKSLDTLRITFNLQELLH